MLDQYADVCGLQRIETTPDDNCFARTFATALQRDLDWGKVLQAIQKELNSNKDYYRMFCANYKQYGWMLLGVPHVLLMH